MKCEIDIDLGNLADEREPVAFRVPKNGEHFVSYDMCVQECEFLSQERMRLIVRRRWQWPEWLTAEWIAMDGNGEWYGYDGEPVTDGDEWQIHGGIGVEIDRRMVAFSPPTCTDWRQSNRRNPRAT